MKILTTAISFTHDYEMLILKSLCDQTNNTTTTNDNYNDVKNNYSISSNNDK